MQHLPGETVQCVNPECTARGRWSACKINRRKCAAIAAWRCTRFTRRSLRGCGYARGRRRAYRPMGRPR